MTESCPGDRFRQGLITPTAEDLMKEDIIREKILNFLLGQKGYQSEDIEEGITFELATEEEVFQVLVSFLIRIEGRGLVLIKCGPGSILARERPALALARLLADYQLPLTVVSNGVEAVVLDTLTGETLGTGLEAIPGKKELLARTAGLKFIPLAEKRIKLERRILAAFEGLGLHGECH
jgi:hypothetical protein